MNQITDVCRLCMNERQLSNIFRIEEGTRLDLKAMACALISVQIDDGLPSLICKACEEKLNSFYAFKMQCETTERKLKAVLNPNLAVFGVKNEREYNINKNIKIKDEDNIEVKLENDISDAELTNSFISHYDDLSESIDIDCKSNLEKNHLRKFILMKNYKLKKNINENIDSTNSLKVNQNFLEDLETNTNRCHIFKKIKNERVKCSQNLDNSLKPFQCERCGRTFKLRAVLKKHILTHSSEKLFGCPLCSKRYSRTDHLVVHMRSHTGVRPYICEICARSFTKNQDLSRHKRIHSDEKKYPCPRCERKFKRSADINSHMRTHTGVRPFVCKNCSKTYTSQSGLRKHNRTLCKTPTMIL